MDHVGTILALLQKLNVEKISKKSAKALYASQCEMATEIRRLPTEKDGKANPEGWVFHELRKQKTKDSD